MRRAAWSISLVATISMLGSAQISAAQNQSRKGHVVIPESSVERVGDSARRLEQAARLSLPRRDLRHERDAVEPRRRVVRGTGREVSIRRVSRRSWCLWRTGIKGRPCPDRGGAG